MDSMPSLDKPTQEMIWYHRLESARERYRARVARAKQRRSSQNERLKALAKKGDAWRKKCSESKK